MSAQSPDPCLLALEAHHADQGLELALEFLLKFSGISKKTPRERIGPAIADELAFLVTEARGALLSLPASVRALEMHRQALAVLDEAANHTGTPDARFPRDELQALGLRAERGEGEGVIGSTLDRYVEMHRALESRVRWLLVGTSIDELAKLDPVRDCDRIFHAMSSSFRVEGRVLELLAINRIAQAAASSLFIRSTREAENNSVVRFYDTYTLFANFFEWGAQSKRGRATVERMNGIHGRYFIPNDAMKYILLAAAFTWTDGAARIAHRPLLEVERRGYFHAFIKLGRAMNITDISDDIDEMYDWFGEENRRTARHTPHKTSTFEAIVGNSLAPVASPELQRALWVAAKAGMDDTFREALGYPEPAPHEMNAVRSVFFTLGQTLAALPQGTYLRSLQNNPAHPKSAPPEQLGASARSPYMPVVDASQPNGGFPEKQKPVSAAHPPVEVSLPAYSWSEIAQHRTRDDLWIAVDGYVYDVTPFVLVHPGGADKLLEYAGRDASLAFHSAPHSAATQVFKLNYRIGRVAPT